MSRQKLQDLLRQHYYVVGRVPYGSSIGTRQVFYYLAPERSLIITPLSHHQLIRAIRGCPWDRPSIKSPEWVVKNINMILRSEFVIDMPFDPQVITLYKRRD